MQALPAAETKALVNGWTPRWLTLTHNTVSQPVGGAIAGAMAAKGAGTAAIAGVGMAISLLDSYLGPAHPVIRIGTQIGPGMLAGAAALKTFQWIQLKKAG